MNYLEVEELFSSVGAYFVPTKGVFYVPLEVFAKLYEAACLPPVEDKIVNVYVPPELFNLLFGLAMKSAKNPLSGV